MDIIKKTADDILKRAGVYEDVGSINEWYKKNLLKDSTIKRIKKEYVKLSDGWFDRIIDRFSALEALGDTGRFRNLEESFKKALGITYKKSWIGDIKKVIEGLNKKRKDEK